MGGKSERIREQAKAFAREGFDPRFFGYFVCFNRTDYYEAHDVLEDLWLEEGRAGKNYPFFKGLIQVAGAFVHLKLHHRFPDHHAHGRRLEPAGRLLKLALANLAPYPSGHLSVPLDEIRALAAETLEELASSGHRVNPWQPDRAPQIPLPTRPLVPPSM
jgi:hypothetical protein